MKKNFHDVDTENIDIANKILNDNNKLALSFNKDISDILHKKKTNYRFLKIAGSLAACLAIVAGITVFYNKTFPAPKSATPKYNVAKASSSNSDSGVSSDYSKVYEYIYKCNSDLDMNHGIFLESDNLTAKGAISSDDVKNISGKSSSEFYNTNEQTNGVHEGDIVKTNGDYIFTLANNWDEDFVYDSYTIYISKVNGKKIQNISKIYIDGTYKENDNSVSEYISEIYCYDNKLVVLGTKTIEEKTKNKKYKGGYLYNYESKTVIYVYDVSNAKKPKLISTNVQDGDCSSTRMIDNYLYVISDKWVSSLKNKEDMIPSTNGKKISCDCIYIPQNETSKRFSIITSLDVTKPFDYTSSISVAGGADVVYVSNKNLYLISNCQTETDIASTKAGKKLIKEVKDYDTKLNKKQKLDKYLIEEFQQSYPDVDTKGIYYVAEKYAEKYTHAINILKYQYNNGAIEYVAETKVSGSADDNLFFDEYNGCLRFVSNQSEDLEAGILFNYYDKDGNFLTKRHDCYISENASDMTTSVYVLDEKLKQSAVIEGLAKGETIYSARYLGDYGYFVTFEQTDPLFSVDFSDRNNPKIIGKLKMPGYSDYLHFYSDTQLFGFGVQTDDWDMDYLKLEMYSLSNGTASKESKLILNDLNNSDALYDYKEMLIDPDKNLIGFSAVCYGKDYELYDRYYVVYKYEKNKFKQLYKVALQDEYSSVRGLYIDNYLYIVDSDSGIYVLNMNKDDSSTAQFQKFK